MHVFLFAAIQCLFFAVLFITGEIYLETDKCKTQAALCVQRMKPYLDAWVSLTVKLAEDSGREFDADKLRALAHSYYRCKKFVETPQKVSLVNSMAALSEPTAEKASEAGTIRIPSARSDTATELGMLRTQYNESVSQLNDRLKKRLPAAVGKLFRQRGFEELRDLSAHF